MAVIKQISVFDGSSWETDNIGADAANIDFANSVGTTASIAGSSNLYTGLSNILPASKLTASRALVTGSDQKLAASNVTATLLGYLSGASSSIQTQINTLNTNLKTKVNKSGDTMTGDLQINKTNNAVSHVTLKSNNGTVGSSPTSDRAIGELRITDSNNEYLGYIRGNVLKNTGNSAMEFISRRTISGSSVFNALSLRIDENGTRSVSVTEAAPWLSALGLSPTSWQWIDQLAYKKQGSVVILDYSNNIPINLTADTWTTLATLPTGYRPDKTIAGVAVFGNQNQYIGGVRVYNTGAVNLYCHTAINKLFTVFNITYII